jgi:hypothetical protein
MCIHYLYHIQTSSSFPATSPLPFQSHSIYQKSW